MTLEKALHSSHSTAEHEPTRSSLRDQVPDLRFAAYPSPFKDEYERLLRLMVAQKDFFAAPTPALALDAPEEPQLRQYVLDSMGDPSSVATCRELLILALW